MDVQNGEFKGTWRLNMRLLRWAAILLPIGFLAAIDVLRHTVFARQLHTISGFLAVDALMAIGVVIFSYTIFNLIARLQRRIVEQNRQLSSLNDMARAAAAKLRLEELMDVSLGRILSSMKADAGVVCLVDMEKEEHSAVCHRGFSPEMVRKIQRAKLRDDPIAQRVVRTGRPVVFEQVFDDPRVAEGARREGIVAGISVPLKAEGEVNGIIAIATRQERHFSEIDRQFLEGIGGQLGMVIRNALLYEQSQLQNRELSALLALGKVVTSPSDFDRLLSTSLDTIVEVVSADAAEVWLADGDGGLVMRCHRGTHHEAFMERTHFRIGEGLPGLVAQGQEPLVCHDLPSDTRFLRQGVVDAGFHAFCALPLRYQNKLMGVLAVAAFSENVMRRAREVRLLEGMGEWLALAIENARLYQQVQDLAVVQERERLAREMHDGIAQLLGYINTETLAVRKLLSDGQLDAARTELTKMEDIARDLYADVREGILGLRTAASRNGGLIPALREYTERYMEMSGVQVDIQVSPEAERCRLAPSVEVQLMRIVQETLTNVRKHAKATAATLSFERDGGDICVTVADNGQGFDLAGLPSTGWPRFGLQTMRERASAVGGSLNIHSAPGQGTTVRVRIPIAVPQNN